MFRLQNLAAASALGLLAALTRSLAAEPALPADCVWHAAADPKYVPGSYLVCPARDGGSEVVDAPSGAIGIDRPFDSQTFDRADAGDPVAMRTVGDFYRERGHPNMATGWYQRAAEKGDALAMLALSQAYASGAGAPRDNEEAQRWLQKAQDAARASQDTDAMVAIGLRFGGQSGAARDETAMLHWLLDAAEGGNRDAMFQLAQYYAGGSGRPPIDAAESLRWYGKLLRTGDPEWELRIANLYRRGKQPIERDPEEAARILKLSAAQGCVPAMVELAAMFERGDGIARDDGEALRWYAAAANLGDPAAMESLAKMYRDGRGTVRDLDAAAHWSDAAMARWREVPPSARAFASTRPKPERADEFPPRRAPLDRGNMGSSAALRGGPHR